MFPPCISIPTISGALDAISAAARAYARGGYFVVMDGIFGTRVAAERIRSTVGVPTHYIVLRPTVETALSRAEKRNTKVFNDTAIIRELYQKFVGLGEFETHTLDTSVLSVPETLEAVRGALAAGTFRLADCC